MIKLLSIVLLLNINSFATSLQELIESSDTNPAIKATMQQAKAYDNLLDATKAYNYPSLDLSYSATYLKDKPVVYLPASFGGGEMQMQSSDTHHGALTLSYPLFSGFAISSKIDEAKLQKHRASLKVDDAKRNLYINIVQLYSSALSTKSTVSSLEIALSATKDSYKKVKGFYDVGISSSSELYKIEATMHQIQAQLISTQNQYKVLLNKLSLISNSKVDDIEELPNILDFEFEEIKNKALQKRPDLISARLMMEEAQTKIEFAKSNNYPSVSLYAQAAYSGDSSSLDGDGYTNKDKSSVGFKVNYNLFSGFKDKNQIEAARESKLANEFMLKSYIDKVDSELYTSHLTYQSFLAQRDSAKAQLKAQLTYEKLVKEQFENQLSDADLLSRAISSSAEARASLSEIEAKLYNAYAKLLLEVDNETFLSSLKN